MMHEANKSQAREKIISTLIALGFFSLLLLPALTTFVGLPGALRQRLGGVEHASLRPEWWPQDFVSGDYQRQFEQWFSAGNNLRSVLVRNDNQISFSLFGSSKKRSSVGKKNFLFEEFYLEDFNGLHKTSDASLQSFANDLARLNTLLVARGPKFLVFLTPSKVATYPEYVPKRLLISETGPRTYERFITLLRDRGIPVLDGVALARKEKQSSPYPVFPPGAAHWSSYMSCKAAEAFTSMLPALIGRNTPQLSCDPAVIKNTPSEEDMDLSRLANIWTPSVFETPLPYPRPRVRRDGQSYLANILFIGDSFLSVFLNYLESDPVYAARENFYYYRTAERFRLGEPGRPQHPIDPKSLDWTSVLARDLIVLEMNEARIYEGGYGFVRDALIALDASKASDEKSMDK